MLLMFPLATADLVTQAGGEDIGEVDAGGTGKPVTIFQDLTLQIVVIKRRSGVTWSFESSKPEVPSKQEGISGRETNP
jgi:hypothetical protein